jgi:hypothetical protein
MIGRRFVLDALSTVNEPEHEPPSDRRWAWIGVVCLVLALIFLEWRQPYYFTQDDNLVCFLPVILHGARSLFEGTFPTWNAHQFLGTPTTTTGVYALTYPPTYLSYALARFVLGNEYLTLEIFAVLHLLAAYPVTYLACRRLHVRAPLAMAATLSFVLCGYFLIAGRSWYYVTPVAVWLPALVLSVLGFARAHPSASWVLGTGLVVGTFFHAGNVQMWFYGIMFFLLALLIIFGVDSVPRRRAIPATSALILGMSLALPLLIPQATETAGPRTPGGVGIARGLLGLVLPWPLAKMRDPVGWGTVDFDRLGHLYYSGTVFVLCGAIAAVSLVIHRWPKRIVAANWMVPLGLLALVLAMGSYGILWIVLAFVPPFDRFRWAFKLLPYCVLFLVLSGAVLMEGVLRRLRAPAFWARALCALTVVLLAYHVWMARPSFYSYGFKPYPALPDSIMTSITRSPVQRLYSFAPDRSVSSEYPTSLRHNLPTLVGAYAVGGYDTFAHATPEYRIVAEALRSDRSAEALQAYGVKWLVVYRNVTDADRGPNPAGNDLERLPGDEAAMLARVSSLARPEVHANASTILSLPDPAPLAFAEAQRVHSLPVSFDGSGAVIDLSGLTSPGNVVVNVLWRPWWRAYVDGVAAPPERDVWGRVRAVVPFPSRTLQLRYEPPWKLGLALALISAGAAVALFLGSRVWVASS